MLLKNVKEIPICWGIDVSQIKELSNRVTLITDKSGKNFVLKKKGNLEEIKNEMELLGYLHANQVKVHLPLMSNNGEYTITCNSENYCIYNYLEGETFNAKDAVQKQSVPQLFGEAIASLHKIMLGADATTKFTNSDLYIQVYGWAVKEVLKIDNDKTLQEIYRSLETDLEEIIGCLPRQLIHRDAHISNMVFNNGHLSGIIDFEIAEINVKIFDICYCSTSVLSEIFSDEPLRGCWFDFVGELLKKYTEVNSLNELEIHSIWHVMLSIQTIFMAYFTTYPTLFEVNKAMFLWLYKNKTMIENKVVEYLACDEK